VHGSVTDLPFADEEFDLASSFKGLAHVERIECAIAEMARVVRPGGRVVVLEITTPQRPPPIGSPT